MYIFSAQVFACAFFISTKQQKKTESFGKEFYQQKVIIKIQEMMYMECRISLQGEIDHHSAERIRNQLDRTILKSGADRIIMDLSNVTFMDSSGIGVLLGRYKLFATLRIYLAGAGGNVDKLLKMSGVYSLMPKKEEKA